MALRAYAFATIGNVPQTGIALTDFSIDVFQTDKVTQVVTQIVTNAAMTVEIGGGFYGYVLNTDDVNYDLLAIVTYTGALFLDLTTWVGTDATYGSSYFATLLRFNVFAAIAGIGQTGLTLADFAVNIYRVTKTDNHINQIATNVAITIEVDGGGYAHYLADQDFKTYDYLVSVQYIGAILLDTTIWFGKVAGDVPGAATCAPSYRRMLPRTLLPLDRWAQILGLDPRHFRQITTTVKQVTTCSNVWKQYSWQENDQVGRYDVALAIQQAEEYIAAQLGYKLLPAWEADERVRTPQPGNPELFNVRATDVRGFWLAVKAMWGHYITGGIEAKTVIEANAAVSYTDEDGDGYKETAKVTVPTTITDEEEIAVYYPCEEGADEWEIRPLRDVSISGGVATIKMWRHQLALPDLIEALDPQAIDGDVDGNFLTVVDVYRHWNNPQQQVQLIWSQRPNTCDCGSVSCAACSFSTQWGCLTAKDHRMGLVTYRPATWDAIDGEFDSAELVVSRNPDRLRIWYYAGLRDQKRRWPNLQMDPLWERAVAYYSLTFLDRPLCGCNNLEKASQHWRDDLSLNILDRTYQLSPEILNNPLGMTRGAMFAWQQINAQGKRLGQAVVW